MPRIDTGKSTRPAVAAGRRALLAAASAIAIAAMAGQALAAEVTERASPHAAPMERSAPVMRPAPAVRPAPMVRTPQTGGMVRMPQAGAFMRGPQIGGVAPSPQIGSVVRAPQNGHLLVVPQPGGVTQAPLAPAFGSSTQRGAPLALDAGRGQHAAGVFRGRRVASFSAEEQREWRNGHWHHGWRGNRLGWWWVIPGAAFFYGAEEPLYAYPDWGSDIVVDEPAPPVGGPGYLPPVVASAGNAASGIPAVSPEGFWYWCGPLQGYFPMVPVCPAPFRQVPPTQ